MTLLFSLEVTIKTPLKGGHVNSRHNRRIARGVTFGKRRYFPEDLDGELFQEVLDEVEVRLSSIEVIPSDNLT